MKGITGLNPYQKRFIDAFQQLTYKQHSWQVWSDFVAMTAIALSNQVDKAKFGERESRYMDLIGRYDSKEQKVFPELFAAVVEALEADPEQDFLGNLFMQLELGSHWKGQFFTPYSLCRAIADIQCGGIEKLIEQKGHVSVNDPACGAGALLVAFANAAKATGIDYQQSVLFVAQDIDHTAAMMCYIQLSLLGCPGYVVIGDTLSNPITTDLSGRDIWYTPLYFSEVWHWRRVSQGMDLFIQRTAPAAEPATIPDVVKDEPRRNKTPRKRKELENIQLTLF